MWFKKKKGGLFSKAFKTFVPLPYRIAIYTIIAFLFLGMTFIVLFTGQEIIKKALIPIPDSKQELPTPDSEKVEQTEKKDSGFSAGLNLLLLNNPKVNGYVKEMIELYNDSAEGKLDSYPYHVPLKALLGMQYNETKTYPGTPILKSYLHWDSKAKAPIWNKDYMGLPATALTLNGMNHHVYKVLGDKYGINNNPSGDWNVFQSRHTYFGLYGGSSPASNRNGYLYENTKGRKSDVHFLPDVLVQKNASLSSEIKNLGIDMNGITQDGLGIVMSILHNGGSGILFRRPSFGVENSNLITKGGDMGKEIVGYANSVGKAYGSLQLTSSDFGNDRLRNALAVIALTKEGFYLSEELYTKLTNGGTVASGEGIRPTVVKSLSAYSKAWQMVYGEKKTNEEVAQILKTKYVKKVTDLDPTLTPQAVRSIYGINNEMNIDKGMMFKLENHTSGNYKKKKSDGTNPRVMKTTIFVTTRHQFDSVATGALVYTSMLAYYGVEGNAVTDSTNPEEYIKNLPDDTFVPQAPVINLSEIHAKKMTQIPRSYLYNVSKLLITQGMKYQQPGTIRNHPLGLPPLGTLGDCSGFTQWVYRQFTKSLGKDVPSTSGTQYAGVKIIPFSEAKVGDFAFRSVGGGGHVALYMGIGTDSKGHQYKIFADENDYFHELGWHAEVFSPADYSFFPRGKFEVVMWNGEKITVDPIRYGDKRQLFTKFGTIPPGKYGITLIDDTKGVNMGPLPDNQGDTSTDKALKPEEDFYGDKTSRVNNNLEGEKSYFVIYNGVKRIYDEKASYKFVIENGEYTLYHYLDYPGGYEVFRIQDNSPDNKVIKNLAQGKKLGELYKGVLDVSIGTAGKLTRVSMKHLLTGLDMRTYRPMPDV